MIAILLLVKMCFGWQIVNELCDTARSVLPRDWCSDTVFRCQWTNVTCDASNELLGVELFNVPLNMPLPDTIDAPGPSVRTLKLVNCGLRGTLPMTFWAVATLRVVDLSDNAIEGQIFSGVVARYDEFSVANNLMGGATYFFYSMKDDDFANLTRLNLANNSFTENMMTIDAGRFKSICYFNIEGNQFYGEAPSFPNARQYRIGRNYFSVLRTDIYNPAYTPDPLRLSDCDMTGVPFRGVTPDWIKAVPNQCHYRYDPGNHLYVASDFTQRTSTKATTAAPTLVGGAPKTTSTVVTSSIGGATTTTVKNAPPTMKFAGSPANASLTKSEANNGNRQILSLTSVCFYLAYILYC